MSRLGSTACSPCATGTSSPTRAAAEGSAPMLSYALRDLIRNPRRTLAALTGVALAVGLFASITLFVDGSAARMTQRAIAPVAIDMQAGLTSPLTTTADSITLEQLAQRVAALPGVAGGEPPIPLGL